MSIDYYSCEYCGTTFPDCGDYDLLVKAMELLKCDRQFLIDKINESK